MPCQPEEGHVPELVCQVLLRKIANKLIVTENIACQRRLLKILLQVLHLVIDISFLGKCPPLVDGYPSAKAIQHIDKVFIIYHYDIFKVSCNRSNCSF